MRGTLCGGVWCVCGIIPAYAGNTAIDRIHGAIRGDHPRVCGEHELWREGAPSPWGSSPRMRGTRQSGGGGRIRLRIIPAYAGNTDSLTVLDRDGGDHPRVCGEHSHILKWRGGIMGSSPRMRGTL